ncbi:unnamed protein product [Vitrella brassicaformis CCMP3155]|uniref:Glycoside hydrolase family 38 N-terminal domain-containing protein n=1 Tax=Vitrella brassicaformis (strain CCMP3155) TaxID=1169540 RepID=A0A0G4FXY6_VITBC|nr:unnamed protein product [Vitrella brassicaformis CCMP3155]|eukprot:CEM20297.1 unnamed protein product [Vitrella brassicaformis CCMP3155]
MPPNTQGATYRVSALDDERRVYEVLSVTRPQQVNSTFDYGPMRVNEADGSVEVTFHLVHQIKGKIEGCNAIQWSGNVAAKRWVRLPDVHTLFVVSMNHLDVGYDGINNYNKVGFITNVINTYFHAHFPRAMSIQETLRKMNHPIGYVYTTHAWLISLYLDCPTDLTLLGEPLICPSKREQERLIQAIYRGDITWHAFPFNSQIEMMDLPMFEFGLRLARDLDDRFGINQDIKVMSQRDVPGLTRAAIPILKKHGVKAITVGQNYGAPAIDPPAFIWKDPLTNSSIYTLYHPHQYGGIESGDVTILPNGFGIVPNIRQDNDGPPHSVEEILSDYNRMQMEYPNARIVSTGWNEFIEKMGDIEDCDYLPTLTGEIGDVWIQGIASDPLKLALYREISRVRAECFSSGKCHDDDPVLYDFSRFMLKVAEHTWGLPGVGDTKHWTNDAFASVRETDIFQKHEMSWAEQRVMMNEAIRMLLQANHPLGQMILSRIRELDPTPPSTDALTKMTNKTDTLKCTAGDNSKGLSIAFDGQTGGMRVVEVSDGGSKYDVSGMMAGELSYQTFTEDDFKYMQAVYGGDAGYHKINATSAAPVQKRWMPQLNDVYWDASSCRAVAVLGLPDETHTKYGGPKQTMMGAKLLPDTSSVEVTLHIINKTTTRLPEAAYLSFYGQPGDGDADDTWEMDKLGQWIRPDEVMRHGSIYQHGVLSGVRRVSSSQRMLIESLDAALTTPITDRKTIEGKWQGTPTALPVPVGPMLSTERVHGMAFNLWNNLWDTNYVLWYPYLKGEFKGDKDENIKYRFRVTVDKGNGAGEATSTPTSKKTMMRMVK